MGIGWFNSKSGYGIVNLEYATALERLTGKVSVGWERKEHILAVDFESFTQEQKDLLNKPYRKEKIGIIKTTPQMFDLNKSDFRIGYSMVENTRIGSDWVEMCNKMDAMFVPSPYLIDVFKDCGVKVPVRNVKQGINPNRFPYKNRLLTSKFVFGTIGYMDERKNWKDLIQAFSSEFDKNENVELWIKNSNPYFAHKSFSDKRIKVINNFYSFDQMAKLYTLFDCFVFPSHAEGSGLPPREAMATGLPVIMTDWSGLSEVADPKFNYPIKPVSIDYPDVRGDQQPGFQARIDVAELMFWLRYVYEHQEEAKQKGKKASEYMHREFSWDSCVKDLYKKAIELYG